MSKEDTAMPTADYEAIITAVWQQDRSTPRSIADQRAENDAFGEMLVPPAEAHVESATGTPVPALWVCMPQVAEETVIMWLHGGGYVIGSPRGYRRLGADLSAGSGARVLIPDYRLAPEHPFPAAIDDAVAIYTWLLDIGGSPERIIIGGDSAGAGLTVATLVALRDRAMPLPAGAVLLSAFADLTLSPSSWHSRRGLDSLVGDHNAPAIAAAYLGDADPTTPLASPVYADLHGLPPLLILVGDHEVLLDDSTTLAARAQADGVDVTVRVFDGLHHIWPVFAPHTGEAREAIDVVNDFIRDHIRGADHE